MFYGLGTGRPWEINLEWNLDLGCLRCFELTPPAPCTICYDPGLYSHRVFGILPKDLENPGCNSAAIDTKVDQIVTPDGGRVQMKSVGHECHSSRGRQVAVMGASLISPWSAQGGKLFFQTSGPCFAPPTIA